MRVAIYARVSTEDKGQDPENQLRDLRVWCTNSGHDIICEYIAGDRHVRFDERGWETACCRMAQATAPIPGSAATGVQRVR
jgi:hypothetical protein